MRVDHLSEFEQGLTTGLVIGGGIVLLLVLVALFIVGEFLAYRSAR